MNNNLSTMNHFGIVVIIALLCSCTQNNENAQSNEKSKSDSLPNTFIPKKIKPKKQYKEASYIQDKEELNNGYVNYLHPVILSATAKVYNKNDTSSAIIQTLKFNTAIKIVGLDFDNNWDEIDINGKSAFIQRKDIATHSFSKTSKTKSIKYFVVDRSIFKYDLLKKHFTDTFHLQETSAEIVKEINISGWKNADILLSFEHVGACCGCSSTQTYILDANNTMKEIFNTYQYYDDGDEGGESTTDVTFPENAESDLIYFHKYEYGAITNEKTEEYSMGVICDSTVSYRWDGKELKKVSE